jgi:aminoglycoside phosphotransferase (APT) family kinase protein
MLELESQCARLADWLKRHPAFGPTTEIASFAPLAGGQSSVLFRLTCVGSAPYVIRMEPRGRQIFFAPNIVREYRIAQGLAQAGIPTAPLIAVETDETILGAPFMVMDEVQGRAPLGRPSMHVAGLLTELSASDRARFSENAIDVLAKIHAVDWRKTHPFLANEIANSCGLDHHLDHLNRWYDWTVQGREFPLTDQALAYLIKARAGLSDTRDVLLWGDARPGNILFAEDQSVAAVLDLEAALVSPRGLDLGYWLMMDRFHADAIGIDRLPGWPSEAETIARYAASSGIETPDLDYYIVMGAFFMATTIIRAADLGIASGKFATDTSFGCDNTATQIIAERLGLPIPPLSPEFVSHRGLTDNRYLTQKNKRHA